jgi:formate dehydrogenase (NADP+) beta subunit
MSSEQDDTAAPPAHKNAMPPADTADPAYFHKVVDCQWACPAHTPVPEYIRLIAAGRYADAYMLNWHSNVFPGVLGRTCDRPCEPACRRVRVEKEPVAICRLKRVAADFKGDIAARLPRPAAQKNGKRIAAIGAGPASLTVARDLLPLGYEVVIFERDSAAGGMMRTQIPKFRLPESVLDEECGYILDLGPDMRFGSEVASLKALLDEGFDAVFVGTGAPRGRDIDVPGRFEAAAHVHLGIEWLASVSFGHTTGIARRVVVLGGGNTAMDCCRTARRLGGEEVKVVVRSGFAEMKASPWEKQDTIDEGIPILNFLVPREILHQNGTLTGIAFEKVKAEYDAAGRRSLVSTGEPPVTLECDAVLVAIGQDNAFAWIERDIGLDFDRYGLPVLDPATLQSSLPKVFFGGDAAFGPKNIITAVAHGHEAAISIDLFCRGEDVKKRPPPHVTLASQKMGLHEWSYDNIVSLSGRIPVPRAPGEESLASIDMEVERGYDVRLAFNEAERCLNCDIETVFEAPLCIECDACADICPMDCITFVHNAPEPVLRTRLAAPAKNTRQALFVSAPLGSKRILAKDEDVCLHCGLCAERCPTGAWDMKKFLLETARAHFGEVGTGSPQECATKQDIHGQPRLNPPGKEF